MSKPTKAGETRIEHFIKSEEPSQLAILPSVDYAEYLFNYAEEIGFCKSNGFGLDFASWSDIAAWQKATNTRLSHWEANAIHQISRSYVASFNASNEKLVPSPYQPTEIDRNVVNDRVGSIFRSIASRNKSKKVSRNPR